MDLIHRLAEALRCLPGVGPKSSQRMIYHLLQHQRQRGLELAYCLQEVMIKVKHCQKCRNFTEYEICPICQNTNRDSKILCIVENPSDVLAIEQTNSFQGLYFVLLGKISPLDGVGPEDIGLLQLKELIIEQNIKEVILALSPNVETQPTVHFINQILKEYSLNVTQLAHGIPSGGELEYLDSSTIGNALRNRARIDV